MGVRTLDVGGDGGGDGELAPCWWGPAAHATIANARPPAMTGTESRSPCRFMRAPASKEPPEKCRRLVRDAGDLVRRLAIELEIELGLGSAVVPLGKRFELAPPQPPSRRGRASHRDAHAGRLPRDAASLRDRPG